MSLPEQMALAAEIIESGKVELAAKIVELIKEYEVAKKPAPRPKVAKPKAKVEGAIKSE